MLQCVEKLFTQIALTYDGLDLVVGEVVHVLDGLQGPGVLTAGAGGMPLAYLVPVKGRSLCEKNVFAVSSILANLAQ